ncbi:SDR family oxidoreductase [Sulfobacillus harzensis]|uniref:SDR family oxidoreductase n=1 Tax=Sulfobacillus harzensis TaxID=2729629 RepID=A0A7Y0L6E7_9FIRM|nr:SDR family oxidoreductase [Sulfobacillus harzensis]NMP24173.1 SDR family oxidoreductase [Sulfobacillus harzensis]
MDLELKDKVILVMGASRGLGRAVAEVVGAEGARVIGTSRQPGLDLVLDTGDLGSCQAAVEALKGEQLDGIFINTGGPRPGDFRDLSDEDWQEAFVKLLQGPLHVVRGLLPRVKADGALLFNTSSSIQTPIAHLLLSNVFRAGIYALVKTLVDELSPRQIRVNAIVPGRIETERVRELDQNSARIQNESVDVVVQRMTGRIPLGRYGRAEEFGRLAAFLLSPTASYINGTAVWVDGGQNRSL